jgi:hypothetical protein
LRNSRFDEKKSNLPKRDSAVIRPMCIGKRQIQLRRPTISLGQIPTRSIQEC